MKVKTKKDYRKRRHMRLRSKVKGTADRPRMCVFKSNRNITVQCIDDGRGNTIASASTLDKAFEPGQDMKENSRRLGKKVAEQLLDNKIESVVFDTGGFGFRGNIKELANAARDAGLKF